MVSQNGVLSKDVLSRCIDRGNLRFTPSIPPNLVVGLLYWSLAGVAKRKRIYRRQDNAEAG